MAPSKPADSSRPPLDKLLQVFYRRNTEHEPTPVVRDDGKVLLLSPRRRAGEEGLELLERGVHGDDAVLCAAATEADHGGPDLVLGLDLTGLEQGLQLRDRDVAEQRARVAVDDGKVRVVALKGREQRERDGVRGGQGQGRGRVEVFDCCLWMGRGG